MQPILANGNFSIHQVTFVLNSYIFDIFQITSIPEWSIKRFPYKTTKAPHIAGTKQEEKIVVKIVDVENSFLIGIYSPFGRQFEL